jgi:hypothetical protein
MMRSLLLTAHVLLLLSIVVVVRQESNKNNSINNFDLHLLAAVEIAAGVFV